jgi:hypothetical protein
MRRALRGHSGTLAQPSVLSLGSRLRFHGATVCSGDAGFHVCGNTRRVGCPWPDDAQLSEQRSHLLRD